MRVSSVVSPFHRPALSCVPRMIAARLRRAPMAALLSFAAIVERDRGVASACSSFLDHLHVRSA